MSLSQFLTNLSNLSNQQYSLSFLVTTADLVDMQTLIHAATLHLYRDSLEIQSQSYQKCAWAAGAMTSLIRSMAESDYDLLCPIIAVRCFAALVGARGEPGADARSITQTCWRSAAEVYLRIRASAQGQPLTTTTELIEQELDTLVTALQRLSLVFPIAGEQQAASFETGTADRSSQASTLRRSRTTGYRRAKPLFRRPWYNEHNHDRHCILDSLVPHAMDML